MGMNYYLVKEPLGPCPHCGREPSDEHRLHIGKSSGGWCFSLHVDRNLGLNSLEDWKRRWSEPGWAIVDEYGEALTPEAMLAEITERGREDGESKWLSEPPGSYGTWDNFHYHNSSERGPRGLLRARHDRVIGLYCGCVGHGEGTWDLITGEFS